MGCQSSVDAVAQPTSNPTCEVEASPAHSSPSTSSESSPSPKLGVSESDENSSGDQSPQRHVATRRYSGVGDKSSQWQARRLSAPPQLVADDRDDGDLVPLHSTSVLSAPSGAESVPSPNWRIREKDRVCLNSSIGGGNRVPSPWLHSGSPPSSYTGSKVLGSSVSSASRRLMSVQEDILEESAESLFMEDLAAASASKTSQLRMLSEHRSQGGSLVMSSDLSGSAIADNPLTIDSVNYAAEHNLVEDVATKEPEDMQECLDLLGEE